jgi:hypothetical protein
MVNSNENLYRGLNDTGNDDMMLFLTADVIHSELAWIDFG